MTIKITTVGQLIQMAGIKAVVYGKAKVGKTRLGVTAPRPFFISAENGLLSLREWPQTPAYKVDNLASLIEIYNWCMRSNEVRQFDTIVLDSVSEIAETCLTAEKRKTRDGRAAYGAANDAMMQMLRDFRDFAHKHVLIIAKEEYDKDEATGLFTYRPSMPGRQLTQQLPYIYDLILQLCVFQDQTTGTKSAWLRTQSDMQNLAGDRSGRLDPWEAPNLTNIFNKAMATGV